MLNIEKYKDEIEENYYRWLEVRPIGERYDLGGAIFDVYNRLSNYSAEADDIIEWLCDEYEEPILDDEERKYLSVVLAPYRHRITCICKEYDNDRMHEIIHITFDNDTSEFYLPNFKKGKMYKGMINGVMYSMKELGL